MKIEMRSDYCLFNHNKTLAPSYVTWKRSHSRHSVIHTEISYPPSLLPANAREEFWPIGSTPDAEADIRPPYQVLRIRIKCPRSITIALSGATLQCCPMFGERCIASERFSPTGRQCKSLAYLRYNS